MSYDDPYYDDPQDDNPYAPTEARDSYQRTPDGGAAILVCGILSLVVCAPIGIAAWIMGNRHMEECRALGARPDGVATAGRICGIIGTVIFGVQLAFFMLWIMILIAAVAAG